MVNCPASLVLDEVVMLVPSSVTWMTDPDTLAPFWSVTAPATVLDRSWAFAIDVLASVRQTTSAARANWAAELHRFRDMFCLRLFDVSREYLREGRGSRIRNVPNGA